VGRGGKEKRRKGKQGPHNSLLEGGANAIRGREMLHCITIISHVITNSPHKPVSIGLRKWKCIDRHSAKMDT